MPEATLFRNRSRPVQILLGGVVPAVIGAIAGVLVGVSSAGYWAIAVVAGIGGFLAGFEHEDGWGGADRGLVGGGIYALSLVIAHHIAGTEEKVSLGNSEPIFVVVVAIIGMFLGAAGGRIARGLRHEQPGGAEAADAADAPEAPEASEGS